MASEAPFGEIDSSQVNLLKQTGWEFKLNPFGHKLTPEEVGNMAADCDGLIAGTEDIGTVLERAKHLKIVSRVGIGLDSVPLEKCRDMGIVVTYTTDAVTMAVAELTVGIMKPDSGPNGVLKCTGRTRRASIRACPIFCDSGLIN